MSTLAASGPTVAPAKNKLLFPMKLIAFTALLVVAVAFVGKYVFRYYLHYNQNAFTDPQLGAANYWVMRGWLMLHITAGMVALLTGPWQFWTGFRARYLRLHRWTGRAFLGAVALGSLGGLRLAIGTTFGWAFEFGLIGLATAWFGTAAILVTEVVLQLRRLHKTAPSLG
jgi:Predicted membrane protein (DUF2306)